MVHPSTPPPADPTYQLPLAEHSGIILGQTESGIMQSLLRLVSLAVANGWEVLLFDPHGTSEQAAAFADACQEARAHSVYQFLQDSGCGVPPEPFGAHAMYFGFQIWSHPNEARLFAQGLLAAATRTIAEQTSGSRTLLLFNHPELLFGKDEIAPLFALMDRMQGSVFLSARSPRDLDRFYAPILLNAQTLIVHRSIPSFEFDFSSRLHLETWQQSIFEQAIRTLPNDECMVISAGEAARVRLGLPDFPSRVTAITVEPSPSGPDSEPEIEKDEEDEELLLSLFRPNDGPGYVNEEPPPRRSLLIGNSDQAHVAQASDFLWGRSFPYRLTRRFWRLRGPDAR